MFIFASLQTVNIDYLFIGRPISREGLFFLTLILNCLLRMDRDNIGRVLYMSWWQCRSIRWRTGWPVDGFGNRNQKSGRDEKLDSKKRKKRIFSQCVCGRATDWVMMSGLVARARAGTESHSRRVGLMESRIGRVGRDWCIGRPGRL